MRVVFAGTPEVALPSLRARGRQRPRARRRGHPPRRPRRPGPPARRLAGRRAGRGARRTRCSSRPTRATRSSRPRCGRWRPDCCPVVAYGALLPAVGARHPRARLGQPALLAAAGLARRRARAAGAVGRRRVHRRDDLPHRRASSTPGPTYGVVTERVRPADTAGDLLDPARRGGCAAHGRHPRRHRGRLRSRRGRSPRTGSRWRPSSRVEEAEVRWSDPALAVDRQVRACTPAPGAWTHPRRRTGQARPGPSRPRGSPARARRAPRGRRARCTSAPAPSRSGSARSRPHGRKQMPAADWARGARLAPGARLGRDGRPAVPPGPPVRRPAAPARRRGSTRPGSRRSRCCARSPSEDAYANLAPARPAPRPRPRRAATPRSPPSWSSGTLRRQGTYDAVLAACAGPTRSTGSTPAVLDVLRLGAHQLLVDARAAPRRRRHLGRPGPRAWAAARPPGSSTPCSAGSAEQRPRRPGSALVAPDPATDPRGFAVGRARPTPAGWSTRWRRRWRRPGGRARRPAGRRQRPAAGHPGRPAGAVHAARSWSTTRPARPRTRSPRSACGSPAATPPRSPPSPRARRRAGRGVAAGRAGARPTAPVEGADERWLDLCAGPGRQGGAARRARRPAGRPPAGGRAPAAPRRAGTPGVAALAGGRRRRRRPPTGPRPAWAPGSFDRVLVDAPCTGLGALRRRPESRWRRTADDLAALVPLQRRAARRRRWSGPCAGRRGRLRDVLAGARRDRRRRRRRARATRDDVELLDAATGACRRCRTPPGRCRARCSCGRTGTAPTRCSWRCCGGR